MSVVWGGAGALHNVIRQTQQGKQEPICTHCRGKVLRKYGWRKNRQRYRCVACQRISYGLPPDIRPSCPFCQGAVSVRQKADGRMGYACRRCKHCFLSEYIVSPNTYSRVVRYRHKFGFWLDHRSRERLVRYALVARCTLAEAVRSIFRYVLTGKVFGFGALITRGKSRLMPPLPVSRDPMVAAMRFPNLWSESAKAKLVNSGHHFGRGFLPTVLGVQPMTVGLDDAAKEGLVYAMHRLQKNHVDTARWLLTNVDPSGTFVSSSAVMTVGRPRRLPLFRESTGWDDDFVF